MSLFVLWGKKKSKPSKGEGPYVGNGEKEGLELAVRSVINNRTGRSSLSHDRCLC